MGDRLFEKFIGLREAASLERNQGEEMQSDRMLRRNLQELLEEDFGLLRISFREQVVSLCQELISRRHGGSLMRSGERQKKTPGFAGRVLSGSVWNHDQRIRWRRCRRPQAPSSHHRLARRC